MCKARAPLVTAARSALNVTIEAPAALLARLCAHFGCADTGVTVYRLSAQESLEPVAADAVSHADGLTARPLGVGAAGLAAAEQSAILITDYQRRVARATPAGRAGVHAAMAVPLLHTSGLAGAVSVGTADPQRVFTPDDLAVLRDVVGPAERWGIRTAPAYLGAESQLLERLYDDHHRLALGIAFKLLQDRGEAEDVVQEAMLAAWRHQSSYDGGRGSERTWLLALVRHLAIDRLRARARRPSTRLSEVLDSAQSADFVETVVTLVDALPVREALGGLPPSQREALVLAFYGGYTHKELALHLSVPLSTVKGRIRLALDRLRTTIFVPLAE